MNGFPYVVTAVSLSSGCGFPHVVTTLSQKKWTWFSVCFHSTLNKQWKVLHMLSLLCTKQCMGFSTQCHCSLSNISGWSFSYAFKAHLLSTVWIFIYCHCCFTKQWMWFSTCCHCPLSKSSGWFYILPLK